MRVLLTAESPPLSHGRYRCGVAPILAHQIEALRSAGHEVRVMYPDWGGTRVWGQDIPLLSMPFAKSLRLPLPLVSEWRIQQVVLGWQPDMVYCNGQGMLTNMVTKIAKKFGVPSIVHVHTDVKQHVESAIWWVPKPVRGILTEMSLGAVSRILFRASQVVTVSEYYRDQMSGQMVLPKNCLVTPGFIEPIKEMDAEEKVSFLRNLKKRHHWQSRLDEDNFIFLSTCRLEKLKRVDRSLRAFAVLCERIEEEAVASVAHPLFLIVGTGPEEDKLKALAMELGIIECVRFTGGLPRDEVRRLYQISHCLLFPSDTDTQGIVMMEGAWAKIPVLGHEDGTIREFLPDEFLAVPPSESIWADKMLILVKSKEYRDHLGQFCREAVMPYSDMEEYKRRLIALCEEVIERKKVPVIGTK